MLFGKNNSKMSEVAGGGSEILDHVIAVTGTQWRGGANAPRPLENAAGHDSSTAQIFPGVKNHLVGEEFDIDALIAALPGAAFSAQHRIAIGWAAQNSRHLFIAHTRLDFIQIFLVHFAAACDGQE
jgi:hypothetical protein